MKRGRAAESISIARSASRPRVISEPTTNATPDAHCVTIDASVTASTGGVSMTTQSNGTGLHLPHQAVHPAGCEQLGRIRRCLSGSHDPEIRFSEALNRLG